MKSHKTLELQLFDGSLPEAENSKIIHPTRWNNRPLSCTFQDHSRLSDEKRQHSQLPSTREENMKADERGRHKARGPEILLSGGLLCYRGDGGVGQKERWRWKTEIQKETTTFFFPSPDVSTTSSSHTTTITAQHPQNLPVASNTRKHTASKQSHT